MSVAALQTADDPLDELAALADAADVPAIARDAREVAERLDERRFFTAIVGQFKRGKSTLINALVGERLLPTGVAPVTSVVTIVRHGRTGRARVHLGDGAEVVPIERLADYVAEAGNPENARGVRAVECFVASPLLDRGLCLVDTPGLGSVLGGNTAETRAFLPHVDAAVLVTGIDPPINADELGLLQQLVAQGVEEIAVVLNKADRHSPDERREARVFTERVLAERVPGRTVTLLETSALDAGALDGPALRARLLQLAHEQGADLIERARQRETAQLAARLRRHLDERRAALLRPIDESERRAAELVRFAATAEQAVTELRHLFDAEHERLARRLDAARRAFLERAAPAADAALAGARGSRAELLAAAQVAVEPLVLAWRHELRPEVEQDFTAAATRFVGLADELLTTFRASPHAPDGLPDRLDVDTELRPTSRFHFLAYMTESSPGLAVRVVDRLRSERGARRAAQRAGAAFARRLLETNASRVVGDYLERAVESRRGVEARVRQALASLSDSAVDAIDRARAAHAAGAAAVAAELARVDDQLAALDAATAPASQP